MFTEKRAVTRYQFKLPMRYRAMTMVDGGKKMPVSPFRRGSTQDVSHEGLLFFAVEKFEVGTIIELEVPTRGKHFYLDSRVAHVMLDPVSGLFRTGIQFLSPNSIFKVKMAEQLVQILEFQKELSEIEHRVITEHEAAERWIEKHSQQFSSFYQ